jgi:hypothetical protein
MDGPASARPIPHPESFQPLRSGQRPTTRAKAEATAGESRSLPPRSTFEPRRAHPCADPLPVPRVEEVFVRNVAVPQRLLQRHCRHARQPSTLRRSLCGRDEQLVKIGRPWKRQALTISSPTSGDRIVVNRPDTTERPCQSGTLWRGRVDPKSIPQQHPGSPIRYR